MPPTGRASLPLLYLVPDFFGPPGGIARYCRMVAQALVAEGTPTHLIALHDKPSNTPHPFASYGACGSSRVKFVQTFITQFMRVRPAMVIVGHCHFAPLAAWLCQLTRTPYVVFLYGIEVWERLSVSRRIAVTGATRRIAISHYTATRAANINGWTVKETEVLYNCLDPDLAIPAPRLALQNTPAILTVSRLSREDSYKGVDVVLQALPRLLQEFPTLTYHIVGDGNARPDLDHLAQTLNISSSVTFHGRVSDETLRGLYAESNVYVMPSRNEGFGFVFLEAMAQGTPAIGGNIDATPEVIEDGVTGFIVDPHSPYAVAEATARLLRDPALQHQMGEAGIRRAHDIFGFNTFQTELWALVKSTIPATRGLAAKRVS